MPGTKLGTGGLVKAYGSAAQEVLRLAEEEGCFKVFTPMAMLELRFPHRVTGTVWSIIGSCQGAEVPNDSQVGSCDARAMMRKLLGRGRSGRR
eukprot:scaffold822_cov250-Pinguiococcus_pyrenoidosus.AAC.8